MKSTDTYNDIKEVNLSYLMLAQNMVRSDREAAIFRLGISEEIADVLGRLTPGQVPASHIGSGFTTLGVGSGGGRHAELARRDIESCMTCHDARGGDPVCITCHVDADAPTDRFPRGSSVPVHHPRPQEQ